MRHVGDAATDVATFVLCDIEEVRDLVGRDMEFDAWEAAVGEGRMAMHHPGADCGIIFNVFVNESPPADITDHKSRPAGGWLRVPSGRMVFTGAEDLWGPPNEKANGLTPTMGAAFEIEPGIYRCDGFVVDWDEGEIGDRIAAQLTPEQQRWLAKSIDWMGIGCFLTLLTPVILGAGGAASYVVNEPKYLYGALLLAGAAWTILLAAPRLRPHRVEIRDAENAAAMLNEQQKHDFPNVVFLLSRYESAPPEPLHGCDLSV